MKMLQVKGYVKAKIVCIFIKFIQISSMLKIYYSCDEDCIYLMVESFKRRELLLGFVKELNQDMFLSLK